MMKSTNQLSKSCFNEFRGEPLCHRDFDGVVLHASRFPPHSYVELHKHTDAYACFLVGGPLRERVGSSFSTHGPLTLIAHPAEEEHEDAFEGPGLCVNLSIATAWINNCFDDALPWSERRAFDRGPVFLLGLRLLRIYAKPMFDSHAIDIEELAGEFLSIARQLPPCRATHLAFPLFSNNLKPTRLAHCDSAIVRG